MVAGRSAFCGTFPGVAPAGRYPAPFFHGARTFLPVSRQGGRPAGWRSECGGADGAGQPVARQTSRGLRDISQSQEVGTATRHYRVGSACLVGELDEHRCCVE